MTKLNLLYEAINPIDPIDKLTFDSLMALIEKLKESKRNDELYYETIKRSPHYILSIWTPLTGDEEPEYISFITAASYEWPNMVFSDWHVEVKFSVSDEKDIDRISNMVSQTYARYEDKRLAGL